MSLPTWPRAGERAGRGRIRQVPEDFLVEEWLEITPEGQGEHLWLRVRKRGENTAHVAKLLARAAGIAPNAVGYAGRKDRHAVTTQWFSLHLPGRPDPQDWALPDSVQILESVRHRRKLQVGALRGNRFRLLVRELDCDRGLLESRLAQIADRGVPNYFGAQRFGREGGNLDKARAWLRGELRVQGRGLRGLLLSAARSLLFNEMLARRVADGTWCTALAGDVMVLDGRRGYFTVEAPDETLRERIAKGEIHPSGPLWGRGELLSAATVAELERTVAGAQAELAAGLERAGLEQERRALRLLPRELRWEWLEPGCLALEFQLIAGGFATSVLHELLDIEDAGGTEASDD